MAQPLCRWGILGTANIARKNWKAIRHADNATLVAVASRDRAKAQRFIDECQGDVPFAPAPTACGSYEELLARKDIDAVYIPLPTGVRKEWVLTAADVRAMLDACRSAGVQFMDGVMFMHSGRLNLLRQTLDTPQTIGPLLRIVSQFSFKATDEFLAGNIRVTSDLEPLGALGDLGWYNIRFSLWAMKEQLPERVTGRILARHGAGGGVAVPLDFSGELFYPNGVTASFYCSFRAENQQWAVLSGTHGYLTVPDFVLPFFGSEVAFEVNTPIFRVQGGDFNMEAHPRRFAVHEYSNGTPNSQETNMIRRFAGLVLGGKVDPHWGDIALKTQQVLDACLRSAREDGRPTPVV